MIQSSNIYGDCSACRRSITDGERMVACSGSCGQIFHSTCASLERSVNKALAHSNNLSWRCDMCCLRGKKGEDHSGFKVILNKVFGVMDSQKDEIENLQKEIKALKANMAGNDPVIKRTCKKVKENQVRNKGIGDTREESAASLVSRSDYPGSIPELSPYRPYKANGLDENDHGRRIQNRFHRNRLAVSNFTENVNRYVNGTSPGDWSSILTQSPLRDLDLQEVWFHFGELREDVNIDLIEQFLTALFPQMTTFVTKHEKKGTKKCLKIGVNLKECFKQNMV